MAIAAGESKLALPFYGGESISFFALVPGWVDESKPTGRN